MQLTVHTDIDYDGVFYFIFFSVTTFRGGLGCMERHPAQRTARVYFLPLSQRHFI